MTTDPISDQAEVAGLLPEPCRHSQSLKTLRTAINWYHAEHGPLPSVPKVTLPEKKPQRSDYWLTRKEAAARIPNRLLPHLRRLRRLDLENGIASVVHYQGEQVRKLRNSWPTIARLAGATKRDAPHIVRHTAATWLMQAGTVSLYDAAGYLGMSPETLWEVYGVRPRLPKVGGKRREPNQNETARLRAKSR
jgi:hypothetical protein